MSKLLDDRDEVMMDNSSNSRQPSLDIQQSFAYVFRDPQWAAKVGVLSLFALCCFLLVGFPFFLGYLGAVVRRTRAGEANPLPGWDDWGSIVLDGIKIFGARALYYIPYLLVTGSLYAVLIASAILDSPRGAGPLRNVDVGVLILAYFVYLFLTIIVNVATTCVMPAVSTVTLRSGFPKVLNPAEVFRYLRAGGVPYVILAILAFMLPYFAQFGIVLFIIGVLPVSAYFYLVLSHLEGQVWRIVDERQGMGSVVSGGPVDLAKPASAGESFVTGG